MLHRGKRRGRCKDRDRIIESIINVQGQIDSCLRLFKACSRAKLCSISLSAINAVPFLPEKLFHVLVSFFLLFFVLIYLIDVPFWFLFILLVY